MTQDAQSGTRAVKEYQTYERFVTLRIEVFDPSLDIATWLRETLKEEPWVAGVTARSTRAKTS